MYNKQEERGVMCIISKRYDAYNKQEERDVICIISKKKEM